MTDGTVGDEPGTERTLPPWWVVLLVGLALLVMAYRRRESSGNLVAA